MGGNGGEWGVRGKDGGEAGEGAAVGLQRGLQWGTQGLQWGR